MTSIMNSSRKLDRLYSSQTPSCSFVATTTGLFQPTIGESRRTVFYFLHAILGRALSTVLPRIDVFVIQFNKCRRNFPETFFPQPSTLVSECSRRKINNDCLLHPFLLIVPERWTRSFLMESLSQKTKLRQTTMACRHAHHSAFVFHGMQKFFRQIQLVKKFLRFCS